MGLIVCSTDDLILPIQFLKEDFLPILVLKSSAHNLTLSCSLLIQVISFTGFFCGLGVLSPPMLNQALTKLWSLMLSMVLSSSTHIPVCFSYNVIFVKI